MRLFFIAFFLIVSVYIAPSFAQDMKLLNNLPDSVQKDILQQANITKPREDAVSTFQ